MDDMTRVILTLAVPFCLITALIGLALGPIANKLAKLRQSLERS
ncbi:hypothetical protein PY793_09415 [Acetobacter fabarum]